MPYIELSGNAIWEMSVYFCDDRYRQRWLYGSYLDNWFSRVQHRCRSIEPIRQLSGRWSGRRFSNTGPATHDLGGATPDRKIV